MVEPEENSGLKLDVGKIQSLIKSLGDSGMGNLLGGNNGADGMGGGVLLGLLLGRSGILGGNGLDGAAGGIASERAAIDAAVASALASANQNNNNSMLLLKDIQDSSQEVISTVSSGNQTLLTTNLQGQIANLQGQASILAGIEASKSTVVNEVHESAVDVMAGLNALASGVASGFSALNTNVLQGTYATAQSISNDGDKTRSLIQSIDSANLNRQLGVAEARLLHNDTAALVRSGNVDVTTTVNQNQVQAQQQAQLQGINTTLATLVPYLQNIGQSVVNLGNMTGSPTTATNVRT